MTTERVSADATSRVGARGGPVTPSRACHAGRAGQDRMAGRASLIRTRLVMRPASDTLANAESDCLLCIVDATSEPPEKYPSSAIGYDISTKPGGFEMGKAPIENAKSKFKQRVEDNPLVVVVGAALAAGVVVAGIMTYFEEESIKALNTEQKIELSSEEQKLQIQLSEVRSGLNDQINDLNRRLRSIELKLPDNTRVYFDISTITIPEDMKTSLDGGFRNLGGGDFFISVPSNSSWSETESTELDFLKSTIDVGDDFNVDSPIGKNLASSKISLWVGKRQSQVRVKMRGGDLTTFSFRPAVYIEHINTEYIRGKLDAFGPLSDSDSEHGAKFSKENARQALDTAYSDEAAAAHAPQGASSEPVAANDPANSKARANADATAQSILDEVRKPSTATDELISALDMLSQPDLASFFLIDATAAGLTLGTNFEGLSYRVISAQKKGNVLYVHQELTFSKIFGADQKPLNTMLKIDEDLFFFGRGTDGFLVRTFIPEEDGAPEAFAWVRAWLAGLRIVVRN
jgi:hypothetical protein